MSNISNKKPVAIVFDMDECTGSWAYAGIFYTMLQYLHKENTRRAKLLFLKYFYPKCARPGLTRCFRLLQRYKDQGRVQDVVCFTHNTGVGYADFIKDCYEIASGTKGLFTKVLVSHRKGESDPQGDKCISVLTKQLNNKYRAPYSSVLCFDDRNDVWSDKSKHRVVKVPAYDGDPKIELKPAIKEMTKFFGIRSLKDTISRKQGEMSHLTERPQSVSKTTLKQLLKSLIHERHGQLDPKDRVILDIFIPHIKQHVRAHSGNTRRIVSPTHQPNKVSNAKTAPVIRKRLKTSKHSDARSERKSKSVKNIKILNRTSPTATLIRHLKHTAGSPKSKSKSKPRYRQRPLTYYNFSKNTSVLSTTL